MNGYRKWCLPLALLSASAGWARGGECEQLSAAKRDALLRYVSQKYKLPDSVSLTLLSDDLLKGSCFHRITFKGAGALNEWNLQLYVSPDGRYLTSDLFDTTVDPGEEERSKARALMAGLSENKGTSTGPELAPVTIVEFSDFQCPYCKQFSESLRQVLVNDARDVRVVFHHMPLSIHPWARQAALGAACGQLQSSQAFWSIHDRLFEEQASLTAANIKGKLLQFAETVPDIKMAAFRSCVENDMSLGLVFHDINLAKANGVNATPTLFVNGHRVEGIKDAAQLRSLIDDALRDNEANATKTTSLINK